MKKSEQFPVRIHGEGEQLAEFVVGEMYRPPMWVWRKAVLKLAELYPDSPAHDIMLLITSKPFTTEFEWAEGGYAIEVREFIYRLYVWYEGVEHNKNLIAMMWLIRLWHYYYCGGPKPDLRNKPRKSKKQRKEELDWRSQMCCSWCHAAFPPSLDLNNTDRDMLVKMFNKWIGTHVKSCKSLPWNTIDEKERARLAEQAELDAAKLRLEQEEKWEREVNKLRAALATPTKTVAQMFQEEQQENFRKMVQSITYEPTPVKRIMVIQKAWKLYLKMYEDGYRVLPEDLDILKKWAEDTNVVLKMPKAKKK